MLDVTSLSFSVRCRRPAVTGKTTLSNDEDRENRAGHGGGGRGQATVDIFQHRAVTYKSIQSYSKPSTCFGERKTKHWLIMS
jgi:hypothetical protein